jgi:ubiquinone/menaquinone biosynthesis C-methylase UbiE
LGPSDLIRRYFDKVAPDYSTRSARGFWNHLREREWRSIEELLQPVRGEKLLELGCGAGFYSHRLKARFGVDVFGVDAAPEMVRQAGRLGVPAWCGQAEDIDHIPDESFDMVLAAGMLEFVMEPRRVLEQATRVLRPGGRLVLLIPRAGARGLAYDWVHRWQGCPAWTRPKEYYIEQLRDLNLSLESQRLSTPISLVLSLRKNSVPADSAAVAALGV